MRVAPHFHERRVLKMYREALMSGEGNESISHNSFIEVCKKHGLVQLVSSVINLDVLILLVTFICF